MTRAYIKYEDLQKTTITCFFQIFPRLLRQGSNGRRIVYDASALGSSAAAALPKKARENLKKTSICSFLKIFVSYVCSSTNSMWSMEEIKKVIAYLSTNVEMGLAVHDQIINELPIIDH